MSEENGKTKLQNIKEFFFNGTRFSENLDKVTSWKHVAVYYGRWVFKIVGLIIALNYLLPFV
jgi:hypothetical protein